MEEDAEFIEFELGNNKKPLNRLDNFVLALKLDKNLTDVFKFNLFTGKKEVVNTPWKRYTPDLSDYDENQVRLLLAIKYGLDGEKNIPRAIDIVAHGNEYHPVQDKLNKLKWDGISRIGNLFHRYLGAEQNSYTTEVTKLFLLGAISRVFKPGIKFDVMICLVDEHQGGGKSTLVRFLAMNDEWFTDDIRNLDDENIVRKLQGHWIIEFSEMLATSNTKTVEGIKSFLSRQKDTYKIPYERYAHDFPRQCVFIGTTNNIDFLPMDRSGNRRFVPIRCNSDQAEKHPLEDEQKTREYVEQCWAEAMDIYKNESFELKLPDEISKRLANIQVEFTPEDPKVGIIQDWLDNYKNDSVCSLMLYKEALGKGVQDPQHWEIREINSIMNKNIKGWKKHPTSDHKARFNKYGKQRAWDRVVPNNVSPNDFISIDAEDQQIEIPFD